jgi:hypothetical protein
MYIIHVDQAYADQVRSLTKFVKEASTSLPLEARQMLGLELFKCFKPDVERLVQDLPIPHITE